MSTITRIYHRFDTLSNWETAVANGDGKLAKGEIGVAKDGDAVQGRIGLEATPTAFSDCPIVFSGYAEEVDIGGGETALQLSVPVVYDLPPSSPPDGTTISWDADAGKWIAQIQVLTLDEYPTADGTVIYDATAEKFTVGVAVEADEIDGGTYEEGSS